MQRFKKTNWQGISHAMLNTSLRWLLYLMVLVSVCVVIIKGSLIVIEKNQALLETRLSAAMQTPVKIKKFEAVWQGFRPELQISGLSIYHPTQNTQRIFYIPHITLELALWQSLLNLQMRLDGVITGLDINISQMPTGEWLIPEFLALGESRPETRKMAFNWLLNQARWSIEQSNITLTPYPKRAIYLTHVSLKNFNFYHSHKVRIYGRINQQAFKIYADLKNTHDVLQQHDWHGRVYAKLPMQPWHDWLSLKSFTIQHAELAAESWLDISAGQLKRVTAQLNIQHLEANKLQELQSLVIKNTQTLASWQQSKPQQWQASLEKLTGYLNGQAIQAEQLSVDYHHQDNISLGIKTLDIAQAANVFKHLRLENTTLQQIQTWLTQTQPSGTLQALFAHVNPAQQKIIRASAVLKQLSVLATPKTIGLKNADIWLSHQPTSSYAGIDITQGHLDLKPIYREKTPLSRLNMQLKWRDLGDAWQLDTNQIALQNADARAKAVLSVWLPKADISAAQMQLLAHLSQGKLASVWRYVPWPPAGDDTLAWLKKALVSGSIERGEFLYQGVLLDTPQRPPSTMQMHFTVRDAVLDYAPDWPMLKNVNADVDIYNKHLSVTAKTAQLYQSAARDIRVDIPDLSTPKLNITAGIDTLGDDIMRLFNESPLKEYTAHFSELVDVKGEILGELALDIPLGDNMSDAMNVNVSAELVGNPIVLKQAPEFDLWLNGMVNYQTGLGLSSQPLQGFLLTQPVRVKLQSVLNNGDIEAVQIQTNGQLTPDNLKPWLGSVTQSMQGQTQYQALLTVPMTDAPVHIVLDSNLVGWQIDLPEPFKKTANAVLATHYEMELNSAQQQTAYLIVGSALQSAFEVKNGLISRMMLLFGENWLGELPPSGLWVSGHLATMNIDDWLPWLRPMAANKTPKTVASVMPALQSFNVNFDEMLYSGYRLKNVRLGYESLNHAVRFQMTSNDLNGEMIWPNDTKQAVKLNIQNIYFPFDSVTKTETNKKIKINSHWAIPLVDIQVNDLRAKAWPHLKSSQLSATITPYAQGLNLQNIVLQNPDFRMEGALNWHWQTPEKTIYTGKLNLTDTAKIFDIFNKSVAINSQQAQAEMALSWQGSPSELSLEKLNGQLQLELKKGRVLQLNKALNLSRILGVLDSDNIKRRLKLDFSDITQKGLAYDEARFEAKLTNGIMSNELIFNSPSLQAKTQGDINLASKAIKQHLEVSMPLGSIVPYAAALVAGPVVGGVLIATEALLDNPLTQMTTLHYELSGTTTEPKMQRIKNPSLPWRKWRKPATSAPKAQ